MAARGERLDKTAPLPYVRDEAKAKYEVPEVTFRYEYEHKSKKEITKEAVDADGNVTGTERYTEISTEKKERKVELPPDGQS